MPSQAPRTKGNEERLVRSCVWVAGPGTQMWLYHKRPVETIPRNCAVLAIGDESRSVRG